MEWPPEQEKQLQLLLAALEMGPRGFFLLQYRDSGTRIALYARLKRELASRNLTFRQINPSPGSQRRLAARIADTLAELPADVVLIPLEPHDDARLFRSLNRQREALYDLETPILFLISHESHPRFSQTAHDLNTWIAPAYIFALPRPNIPDLPPPAGDVAPDLAVQIDYYRDHVRECVEQDRIEWVCDRLLPDLADAYKRARMYKAAGQVYHRLGEYYAQQFNDRQRNLFNRRVRIVRAWRILQGLTSGDLSSQDSTVLRELFGQGIFSFEETAEGVRVIDEDEWKVDFGASLRSVLIALSSTPVPIPPSPPPYFIGREAELAALTETLTSGDTPQAIVGMGGVGKTALAQRLAIQLEDVFPGGVFWTDLAANDGDPLPVLAVWAQLCGRGVSELPDLQARTQVVRGILSRHVTEQGRALVVLDDLRRNWLDGAYVLQAACPAGVSLVLTTRDKEVALALDATIHYLDVLTLKESLELLNALAGPAVEQEPEAARRLVQYVGYLPLALELAGRLAAQYTRKPGWRLASLCEEMETHATETLELEGQLTLTATLSLSYESLNAEQQRLFRSLSVFAPAPFAAEHVAAVVGWEVEVAEARLDELVALSLARWEVEEGEGLRYTLHPLLRAYAAALLKEADGGPSIRASYAVHYLDYAKAYNRPTAADYAALKAEHQNLLTALDQLWSRVEGKRAAEQYVEMLSHLTYYLRSKSWGLDYRRHVEQAYAVACTLKEWRLAAWLASEAAATYYLTSSEELEMAEDWGTRMEEALAHTTGIAVEGLRADALRLRGMIAMRRYEYEGSRRYLEDALHLLEKLALKNSRACRDIEDIHIFLAILEMRYNPSVDYRGRYDTAMAHFYRALGSAEERDDIELQAVVKTNIAELMIWWDEWDAAAQALEEALTLSRELSRIDLLAEDLALEAFVYQHKSQEESDRARKIELLDIAIERAEESLEILRDTPASAPSLLALVRAYLLLAGLHRSRQDVGDDAEDSRRFEDYLSEAHDLLEVRKASRGGAMRELELAPDALYEAACYEAMSGDLGANRADLVGDLLFAAIAPQPGWYKRAETDFRLDPFRKDERQWEILGERVKKAIIIGGRPSKELGGQE